MESNILRQVVDLRSLRSINAVENENLPLGEWRVGPDDKTGFFKCNTWLPAGSANDGNRRVNFETALPRVDVGLTGPGYEGLLVDAKLVVWSESIQGQHPETGTKANGCYYSMRPLFGWMAQEGLSDFGYVTRDRVWADGDIQNPHSFVSFLLAHMGGDPAEITVNTAQNYLNAFNWVFKAAHILESFGRPVLPEHPFQHGELGVLLEKVAKKPMQEWRPIPDEVQIPLLNASEDWLGTKAEDVLRLLELERTTRRKHQDKYGGHSVRIKTSEALTQFKFSKDQDGQPWFSLGDSPLRDVAHLCRMVQAAGMIALQQCSGMRSGELLALSSKRYEDGRPTCLEVRKIGDGSKSLVLLHTVTSKINDGIPDAHEFVVGSKANIPFVDVPMSRAERAVDVLLRLGDLIKGDAAPDTVQNLLFVNWSAGGRNLPAETASLTPFYSATQNTALRYFLRNACGDALENLPDNSPSLVQDGWLGEWRDSMGEILHSHQLRKSFANFAYSMEPSLMEEIRVQYGHVSMAMTSRYANNKYQIRQANEIEAHLATEHIVAALSASALGGKGRQEMEDRSDWQELRKLFDAAEPMEKHEVVRNWLLRTNRLVDEEYWVTVDGERTERHAINSAVSNAAHGLCAAISIRGSDMECRKDGGTTSSLLDGLGADKRYRTPSKCLGCTNYLILPRHRPFWEDRYRRAEETVAFLKADGRPLSMYETQLAMAKQARAWLRAIGVDEVELNAIAKQCAEIAKEKLENA